MRFAKDGDDFDFAALSAGLLCKGPPPGNIVNCTNSNQRHCGWWPLFQVWRLPAAKRFYASVFSKPSWVSSPSNWSIVKNSMMSFPLPLLRPGLMWTFVPR